MKTYITSSLPPEDNPGDNKEAKEIYEKLVSTNASGFVYLYNNFVEHAFIIALRTAFKHPATPAKYRYDEDINKSQVDIRSDFPQRILKFPIIAVILGTGNAGVTYVGDEFLREVKKENNEEGLEGYLYGGKLTLKVSINIATKSKRDIEHLSDLVTGYVRYLFRGKFAEVNMAYCKVDSGAIKQEESMFTSDISTEVTCEFTHFIDKNLYEAIHNLEFNIGTYLDEDGLSIQNP